ncbi:hypothetical protein ACFE04_019717 [Oxalis oulophora]
MDEGTPGMIPMLTFRHSISLFMRVRNPDPCTSSSIVGRQDRKGITKAKGAKVLSLTVHAPRFLYLGLSAKKGKRPAQAKKAPPENGRMESEQGQDGTDPEMKVLRLDGMESQYGSRSGSRSRCAAGRELAI